MLTSAPNLQHLDIIYTCDKLTPDGTETVVEIAQQKDIVVLLKGLSDRGCGGLT